MKPGNLLRNSALALSLLFALAGCSAPAQVPPAEPAGVQDIQPGDKSIIQAPANNRDSGSKLEERSI